MQTFNTPLLDDGFNRMEGRSGRKSMLAAGLLCMSAVVAGTALYSRNATNTEISQDSLESLRLVTAWTGNWGSWKDWKHAPAGFAVCGARIRFEAITKNDDTAANGLEYAFCHKDNWDNQQIKRIEDGWYGDWGDMMYCDPGYYVSNMQVRYEDKQGGGDDTALNALRLLCRDINNWDSEKLVEVNPGAYGDWKNIKRQNERRGYFIVGSRVKFDDCKDCDDTAWNGIENDIQQVTPISSSTINVNTSWYLDHTGKDIDMQFETKISTSSTTEDSTSVSELYSSAISVGASVTASVEYGMASGEATVTAEYDTNSEQASEISSLASKTISMESTKTINIKCPAKGNQMAKLYMFKMDMSSSNIPDLSVTSTKHACCYGAEKPLCPTPAKCIDLGCQTCSS